MSSRPSRLARLARLMLLMSMACAASGMLLDWRVKGLLSRATAGTTLQPDLERADQIATVLLLFTLLINVACVGVNLFWIRRVARAGRPASPLSYNPATTLPTLLLIPILNPLTPLAVRGVHDSLSFAMAAKAGALIAASYLFLAARSLRTAALQPTSAQPESTP